MAERLADDARDLFHLGLIHPERGRARGAHPDPRGIERRLWVERDPVLVDRDPDLVADGLGLLAADPERSQVAQGEVRVRPARDDPNALVRQTLRECVVFAPQNVLQDPPFSRLDIATCRNLLIYLEPDVLRAAAGP